MIALIEFIIIAILVLIMIAVCALGGIVAVIAYAGPIAWIKIALFIGAIVLVRRKLR